MSRNSCPVLITLLFSMCVSDCTNVTAKVGTKVILPCNCSNMSSLISWQRGITVVYTQNRSLTALQYCDRTEIQENNCSLILSQVSASDEGVYTCYHKAEAFSYVRTTLQVTGAETNMLIAPKVSWNVPVVFVACGTLVVLLISLSVWLINRQKRTKGTRENQPEQWSLRDQGDPHRQS